MVSICSGHFFEIDTYVNFPNPANRRVGRRLLPAAMLGSAIASIMPISETSVQP